MYKYKELLNSIEGIEIFPIISLVIFFGFFVGLGFWIFIMKKQYFQDMATMPLQEEDGFIDEDIPNTERNVQPIENPKLYYQ